jgi:hypothetical protein
MIETIPPTKNATWMQQKPQSVMNKTPVNRQEGGSTDNVLNMQKFFTTVCQ